MNQLWKIKWCHLANDNNFNKWRMAIVCSFIRSNNWTKHKTGTQNQHLHVSWAWVQCVRRLSHYAVTPDDDAIHWRSCRRMIAVVSAMPRQSFVSIRQLSRNFDDGRPSAEGHPRWHNQPDSNSSYSVAVCLAQWTAHCHAARYAVRYFRSHSLDGATLFSKLGSNKLWFNVKTEMTLILPNLMQILSIFLKSQAVKKMWPQFFWPTLYVALTVSKLCRGQRQEGQVTTTSTIAGQKCNLGLNTLSNLNLYLAEACAVRVLSNIKKSAHISS